MWYLTCEGDSSCFAFGRGFDSRLVSEKKNQCRRDFRVEQIHHIRKEKKMPLEINEELVYCMGRYCKHRQGEPLK